MKFKKTLVKLLFVFAICSVFALFNPSLCGVCEAKEISVNENLCNSGIVDLDVATEDTTTETPLNEQQSNVNSDKETDDTSNNTNNDVVIKDESENEKDITDGLVPEVDTEDFFQRIYNKLFSATNGVQKVVAVILVFLFVINLIMIGVSFLSNKNKVLWYILTAFLLAVLFFCDVYAVEIITAINNWIAK